MSVDRTRRSIVAAAVSATVAPRVALAQEPHAAFVGQSGEPHSGRLVLGILATSDAAALRRAVSEIRRRSRYRRQLVARSTDRFKVAFVEQWLDFLASQEATRFTALKVTLPQWQASGSERRLRMLADALADAAPPGSRFTIAATGDPASIGSMAQAIPGDAFFGGVVYAYPRSDDLLQLAGYMAALANDGALSTATSPKARLGVRLRAGFAAGGARSGSGGVYALREITL